MSLQLAYDVHDIDVIHDHVRPEDNTIIVTKSTNVLIVLHYV